MKKIVLVCISGIIILALISIVVFPKLSNKENNVNTENGEDGDWEKLNIRNYSYNKSCTIDLDLDGDNVTEKVNLNEQGRYISINGTDYIINKYFDDDSTNSNMFNEYNINQYHILDLNDDRVLEIIHRTFSDMISPITNKYTIYNFKDNNLKEIGNISIIGNIPDEIYVKDNTIKFEYWPYESPQDYTKEVIYELNI